MAASRNKRRADELTTLPDGTVCRRQLWLFHQNKTLGHRALRPLPMAAGESRCVAGTAVRVYDYRGVLVGYQFQDPPKDVQAQSLPSSCVLSRHETELIAGTAFSCGKSRTASMTPEQRKGRIHRGRYLPEEDEIELAVEKQRCFLGPVSVRGDRAVRVYPK